MSTKLTIMLSLALCVTIASGQSISSVRGSGVAADLSGDEANRRAGASLDLSGGTAVVGVPGDEVDGLGSAGTVRVLSNEDGNWREVAVLSGASPTALQQLGWSVGLEGTTIVAGAPFAGTGVVRVFDASGEGWAETGVLTGDAAGERFGLSVAISGDLLVVGAPYADGNGSQSGEARVFSRSGDAWTAVATLVSPEAEPGQLFGFDVAVASGRIFVSAPRADDASVDGGAITVFEQGKEGWSVSAYLVAPDAMYGTMLGWSMDVDGNRLVAGGPGDLNLAVRAGCAHVFEYALGTWTHAARLEGIHGEAYDEAGVAVAVDDDIVMIGVPNDDERGWESGSISVYQLVDADWEPISTILGEDSVAHDRFAEVLAIDGIALAGAPRRNVGNQDVGGAYPVDHVRCVNWTAPGGGDVSGEANWSPQHPGKLDAVVFSLLAAEEYVVQLDEPLDVAEARVELDGVVFEYGSEQRVGSESGGRLVVSGRPALRPASLVLQGGTLAVPGDVVLGEGSGSGMLSVGSSTLKVEGDWRQEKGGTLVLELRENGTAPVAINGEADLGGALVVTLPEGLAIEAGDAFMLIGGSGAVTDTRFDVATMPGIGDDLYLHLTYSVGAQGATGIFVVAQPFSGLLGFGDPDSVPLDSQPASMAVADLTGGGVDDILVAIGGSPGSLYVLRNDGSGGFSPEEIDIYSLGTDPAGMDVGEVNGDGSLDVAVTNTGDDTVQLFLNANDGSGDLLTQGAFSTGVEPVDVALMDYNDDGRDDLVVSCSGSGTLEFFSSQFSARGGGLGGDGSTPVGDGAGALDPGDVGDTKDLEVVVVNGSTGRSTTVAKGGLGTPAAPGDPAGSPFHVISEVTVGTGPQEVLVADLDGDGDGDVIVVNTADDLLTILISDGTGTGYTRLSLPVGDAPSDVVAMDFDLDGDLDIGVVSKTQFGVRQVQMLRNDIDLYSGQELVFAAPSALDAGFNPVFIDAGRMDADPFSDLVVVSAGGPGLAGPAGAVNTLPNNSKGPCPTDIDGDGNVGVTDLLLVIAAWNQPSGPEDLNGDGIVNVADLLLIIGTWGPCS